jgi:hypothetical protein
MKNWVLKLWKEDIELDHGYLMEDYKLENCS